MTLKLLSLTFFCFILASCSSSIEKKSRQPQLNVISENPTIFSAQYGKDYILKGDRIAKYPDFDISLFSVIVVPGTQEKIFTYEITGRDGYEKHRINIQSNSPQKEHLFIENSHYYYHSNGDFMINIYIPPQLLAKN